MRNLKITDRGGTKTQRPRSVRRVSEVDTLPKFSWSSGHAHVAPPFMPRNKHSPRRRKKSSQRSSSRKTSARRSKRKSSQRSYRAGVLSKLALEEPEPGLLIQDTSTFQEETGDMKGHIGSREFNAEHLVTKFFNASRNDIVEVAIGTASIVDLKEQSILTQKLATCYGIVLVCKSTDKAAVCHMPDTFAQRLSLEPSWGRDSLYHLVRTLRHELTNNNDSATTHALVVGGQKHESTAEEVNKRIFLAVFFLSNLKKRNSGRFPHYRMAMKAFDPSIST